MTAWKEILVLPEISIRDAIRVLDKSAKQIVLVVDGNNRLIGTVTDGDIRRGILKGISLDKPVQLIMNPHPIVARLNDSRERVLTVMKMKGFRQMPVLDECDCVVGVEFLDELIQLQKRENWVVLMAGGIGKRLRPLTQECPKPLIHVGKKPILETILENFIEYGFQHFFISVNYKAEMVEDYFGNGSRWGVEIRYLREDKGMGTAGPLGFLPPPPLRPILVMNGDLLTKVNFRQLLDFHEEHQAQATICVREYHIQIPYGVVNIDKHRLIDIEEKPVKNVFVNAGIYVLEPKTLDFVPKNSYLDMPDLFKKIIAQGFETTAFPIREYWLDIGRMDDLERAKGDYAEVFEC